ncbi:hypothetical protein HDU96_003374 [Phlyctochytrium bullatum]|nr:hypothetical protein HDU96_003374 [Phlyctochytrium bullatum]
MRPFTAIAAALAAVAAVAVAQDSSSVPAAADPTSTSAPAAVETSTATDVAPTNAAPSASATPTSGPPPPLTGGASDFSGVPLVPANGQILLGSWYMRAQGEPAKDLNARLKGIPGAGLSFFQTDFDITNSRNDPLISANITDLFLQELEDTGTDAVAYVTVYPFGGYDMITDAMLTDLAQRVLRILQRSRSVFLRLYPEMNGSWFNYGQNPGTFIAAWRRAYDAVTAALPTGFRSRIAFVWAPNSGNGYPYPGGAFSPVVGNAADAERIRALDSNGDGVFDGKDDAYSPYYPGDEYVDWVGLSIYHYGRQYPWITNDIPESNKFEGLLQGQFNANWGLYPFYSMFSSSTARSPKPFILAEGGATFHMSFIPSSASKYPGQTIDVTTIPRATIKRAFWRQFLSTDFLTRFPNFRAASTFEFMKSEEDTVRDFTNFGIPGPNRTLEGAAGADDTLKAFLEDAQTMSFVKWASTSTLSTTTARAASTSAAASAAAGTTTATPKVVSTTVPIVSETAPASVTKSAARRGVSDAMAAVGALMAAVAFVLVA